MFCTKCGSKISEEAIFCINCGTKTVNNQGHQPQDETSLIVNQVVEKTPASSENSKFAKRAYSFDFRISGLALKGLVTLLVFINAFSGIVGGIWLAIIGQWGTILAGFGYSFIMPFIYGLVILPNMGLLLLLSKAVEKRNKFFTGLLGLVSGLYTYGVLGFWVMLVFSNFVLKAELKDFFPLLLWGYSTAMAPLSYMASKEGDDNSSGFALLFAQVMYLVMTLIWFFGITGGVALFILAAPTITAASFLVTIVIQGFKEQQSQEIV